MAIGDPWDTSYNPEYTGQDKEVKKILSWIGVVIGVIMTMLILSSRSKNKDIQQVEVKAKEAKDEKIKELEKKTDKEDADNSHVSNVHDTNVSRSKSVIDEAGKRARDNIRERLLKNSRRRNNNPDGNSEG